MHELVPTAISRLGIIWVVTPKGLPRIPATPNAVMIESNDTSTGKNAPTGRRNRNVSAPRIITRATAVKRKVLVRVRETERSATTGVPTR